MTVYLFIYVGIEPNTEFIKNVIKLTERGYIPTDDNMCTNIAGIYAVGDVRDKLLRQVVTAVSDGATAKQFGLLELVKQPNKQAVVTTEIAMPPKKVVDQQIVGIDVLALDSAQNLLWQQGIYAETGMGCTGPIILVALDEQETAFQLLKQYKFIM